LALRGLGFVAEGLIDLFEEHVGGPPSLERLLAPPSEMLIARLLESLILAEKVNGWLSCA